MEPDVGRPGISADSAWETTKVAGVVVAVLAAFAESKGVVMVAAIGSMGPSRPGGRRTSCQWVRAGAGAGDFDGNGTTEIAVVSRQGALFVYTTPGVAAGLDGRSARSNLGNTAVFAAA